MEQDANPVIKTNIAHRICKLVERDDENYAAQRSSDEQLVPVHGHKGKTNYYLIATWSAFALLIGCTSIMIKRIENEGQREKARLEQVTLAVRYENDRITERNMALSAMLREAKQKDEAEQPEVQPGVIKQPASKWSTGAEQPEAIKQGDPVLERDPVLDTLNAQQ